jgi:GcrA cell cycle regulator
MWTDAAIETLRQMALEGKSASTIAAVLGAPSRNAVIGKANRIGIKLTGNIHCSAPRPPRSVTERPRRSAIARAVSPSWKRAAVPAVPRERKPAWVFAEAQVGEMLKVGLEEINESACRWPIGDPTTKEFAYYAALRPRRAALIAPDIAGWPISRRIRGSGTASVTWPSSRWPPEAATSGVISARRIGAPARASGKALVRARSFRVAPSPSLAA